MAKKIIDFLNSHILRKVPEITVFFWIIKLLTTAMGESTSDFMVHHLSPVIAVLIGASAFAVSLIIQFCVKKYIPFAYWFSITMVAIFGTMVADILHVGLRVPYIVSTSLFLISLLVILFAWHFSEKTLSIHSINTRKREIFYWLTVIATFALGTAAGDMTATTLHLGYLTSGVVFGLLFLLPLLAYKNFHVNEVFTFWCAYIMTRPFGASFADWTGRARDLGGIGWGTGRVSISLGILIILCVTYLTISHIDVKYNPSR